MASVDQSEARDGRHAHRHSFATDVLVNGVVIAQIGELLDTPFPKR
jgi:site-specific recombinase XerD